MLPLVLLVEDEDMIRESAKDLLIEVGYRVVAAANADEALDLLDQHAAIGLLFTDVHLPGGLDGVALAREAARRRPGLRILFTSGRLNLMTPGERARLVPNFLAKPYRRSDLETRIAQALRSGDTPRWV